MNTKKRNENLKILLLTGIAAKEIIKANSPKNAIVKVLPINVAAFITIDLIRKNLKKEEVNNFDLVLVPGFIKGDVSILTEEYGIPFLKGPRYANDIKFAITENNPFDLSSKYSADKILKEQKFKESYKILQLGYTKPLDNKKDEFYIGNKKKSKQFPIGFERPPLVMAEVVDATIMSMDDIVARVDYYLQSGADIIDIGATIKSKDPNRIKKIITELHKIQTKIPFGISIDSLDSEEILAAVNTGVDLVLSIDHGNIDELIDQIPKETGIVIIPTNTKKGIMPSKPEKRVESLLKLKQKLNEAGYSKIFADPIIEIPIQPGFINSLEGYIQFRKADSKTPMMTCVGNVTEFIEADPIGINVLFGSIAVELGIQLLLATDVSVKCRGGVSEIRKGRDLAFVSNKRKTPPKGHGIDILMAKSRTGYDSPINIKKSVRIIELSKTNDLPYSLDYEKDPKGSFTIWIDYHKQKIYTIHLDYESDKPDLLFISSSAREILEEIVKRSLVSKFDHAIYLGRELERAEICLYLGKTYIQNEQIFKEKKN